MSTQRLGHQCCPPSYPTVDTKLKGLDIFAGCGSLSQGLQQSCVAKFNWAVEKSEVNAEAYKLHNPDCKVFAEDCNRDRMDLKICLRHLVKMGNQCTFAVLQAGHYGVAQSRRRLIIMAAGLGENIPLFPEPRHVFSPHLCQLSVQIEEVHYESTAQWKKSALYKTVNVQTPSVIFFISRTAMTSYKYDGIRSSTGASGFSWQT